MMGMEFGIFPLTSILLAGLLYGIYRLIIRMRCHPRISQWYIVAAVLVSLAATFIQPVKYVFTIENPVEETANVNNSSDISQDKSAASKTTKTVAASDGIMISEKPISESKPLINTNVFIKEAIPNIRMVYYAGVVAMLLYLIAQMIWMVRIRKRSTHMEMEKGIRVYDTDIPTPFSFANSIFMPKEIDSALRDDVFLHESKHLARHHYAKLCIMQILLIFQWFNPFVWLFTHEHKLQQEMEVDQDVMNSGCDREQYQMNLLKMCLKNSSWVQIMPAFGSSIIKRRILFMNRWKPSRFATMRILASFALLIVLIAATAFATLTSKPEKSPLDGCWEVEWTKSSDSPYEESPFLTNNLFVGNGMEMNFSWYSRYNQVNMNFNFSGEPVSFHDGKHYDYKGDIRNITMLDADTYLKKWKRTPKMTAMQVGPEITEQWRRTEPDKGALRILRAFSNVDKDKSHLLSGVWREVPDTVMYQAHYLTVSNGIYGRFTVYSDPDSYWCSAGGWCGDIRFDSESKVFVGDRYEDVEWHSKDSITLIIPRDGGKLEKHVYRRSELPERFVRCLTALDGYE